MDGKRSKNNFSKTKYKSGIMDNFNDEPTAVEMIKHPASLIFLAGLGDEKPTGLLKILGAGKTIDLKNDKEVQKIGANGKTIHQ